MRPLFKRPEGWTWVRLDAPEMEIRWLGSWEGKIEVQLPEIGLFLEKRPLLRRLTLCFLHYFYFVTLFGT